MAPKEVLKDRSMVLQKEMLAKHFARLEKAPENHEPVVYTFVPGNLTELIRSFGALPVLPEINALQSGMRKLSGDYIAEAERAIETMNRVLPAGLLQVVGSLRQNDHAPHGVGFCRRSFNWAMVRNSPSPRSILAKRLARTSPCQAGDGTASGVRVSEAHSNSIVWRALLRFKSGWKNWFRNVFRHE